MDFGEHGEPSGQKLLILTDNSRIVTSEVLLEYHLCRLVSLNLECSPTCSGQVNNVTGSMATDEMGNKCMQS